MLPLRLAPPGGRALRVLAFGAHSDDIEIGCGGTLLQFRAAGAEIHWVVLSGSEQRQAEARHGARLFLGAGGIERVRLFSFRDGFFPAQFGEIKEAFEDVGRRVRPDVVFTHFRDDRHQDHRVLSDLAWNTFRRQLVLEYEVPKWDGDLSRPNCYVPLSRSEADRKIRALLAAFGSQRSKDWFEAETFRGLMRLRGVECRASSGMAEAFYARKMTFNPGKGARA
jgi:LmbE family N-acetylglucosaminyl deacetylase